MKKFFPLSLIFGITFSVQSALAIPSQVGVNQVDSQSASETRANPDGNGVENQSAQAKAFKFNFDNAYDYAACLDVILLAYEGRNSELENAAQNECTSDILNTFGDELTKDTALELVKSAHFRATEGLESPLYPSFGIRRRVAINLGYVYDIDKNNSDILELIK